MVSVPRRRAAAVAAAGTFMALGLGAPVARAYPVKAESPAPMSFAVQGCAFDFTAPIGDRSGHVSAAASSQDCEDTWAFTAQLQTSHGPEWVTDSEERWTGNAIRTLGSACAGLGEHRVVFHWDNGSTSGTMNSPTIKLNCG